MTLNKKIAIPLLVVVLAAATGGGWYLWNSQGASGGKEAKASEGKQQYTCAMHPFILQDKPGLCPVCNMALIKKIEQGPAGGGVLTEAEKQQAALLGEVSLSATQLVMANVATVTAEQAPLKTEVRAVGIVQYDQSRQAKVTAWISGRIDKLNVDTVGSYVSKNRPVAEIYSPELVATQQEYLLALRSQKQLGDSGISAIASDGDGLVQSAKQRLMLFGVKEKQVADLEKAGKPNIRLAIYPSQPGIVIEKLVQQGQYLNTGDVLFNIADLSRVWVEVEVYENEAAVLKIGQQVEIVAQAFAGKPYRGRVSFIYPFVDPKSRTIKLRVEMPNPGMKLKPDMFVNATIKIAAGNVLTVPDTAVIDTGLRQVLWVEKAPGRFVPREVQVGQQADGMIQILSGLTAGEKVAVSGAYLIDSESQLRGGSPGHGGPGGAAQPANGQAAGAAAPHGATPAKKGGLSVDDMNM